LADQLRPHYEEFQRVMAELIGDRAELDPTVDILDRIPDNEWLNVVLKLALGKLQPGDARDFQEFVGGLERKTERRIQGKDIH